MQLSKIMCLFFATTAFAVSTSTRRVTSSLGTIATRAAKVATPRVLKPATPPTKQDVMNSIDNWATSVNTVNTYLDDPQNKTKLQSAIVFAKDEPVQLATLMKTTGLSTSGVNSGKILMGNFPSIVSNLNQVQAGSMSTNDATMAVNFNRCCTVLPAIGALWAAAGTAMKVANTSMPMPNLEAQCSQMSCTSGVSGGAAANATTMTAATQR